MMKDDPHLEDLGGMEKNEARAAALPFLERGIVNHHVEVPSRHAHAFVDHSRISYSIIELDELAEVGDGIGERDINIGSIRRR